MEGKGRTDTKRSEGALHSERTEKDHASFAAVDSVDYDASISKLESKLAKAIEKGDHDKAESIRSKLAALELEVKTGKLEHKIAKARARGDEDRATRLAAELAALHGASTLAEPEADVSAEIARLQARREKAKAKGDRAKAKKLKERIRALRATAGDAESVAHVDEERIEATAESSGGSTRELKRIRSSKRQRQEAETDTAEREEGEEDTASKRAKAEAASAPSPAAKVYPPPKPGNVSILLFYAYVKPHWTYAQQNEAIAFIQSTLQAGGVTGRVRVAVEGLNATLSGPAAGIEIFCNALREYQPKDFGNIDFKVVHGLQDNKAFKGLKVWPVEELVTYGFDPKQAPLEQGGTHVEPEVFTQMAADPDAVLIDVRNANETAIGRFIPPEGGALPLDPRMRRSTEFVDWVDANLGLLKQKKTILMCCTAGIRCERASALIRQKLQETAPDAATPAVVQLEGGIHRYLDAYPEDGGIWAGKNYTFDKRFSHGAAKAAVVSSCCVCAVPWDRYQAQLKCTVCRMEVIVCKECQKSGKAEKSVRLCWLCAEADKERKAGGSQAAAAAAKAAAFARAGGGRDGEGEGKSAPQDDRFETGGSGGGGRGRGGLSMGPGRGGFGGRGAKAGGWRGR